MKRRLSLEELRQLSKHMDKDMSAYYFHRIFHSRPVSRCQPHWLVRLTNWLVSPAFAIRIRGARKRLQAAKEVRGEDRG